MRSKEQDLKKQELKNLPHEFTIYLVVEQVDSKSSKDGQGCIEDEDPRRKGILSLYALQSERLPLLCFLYQDVRWNVVIWIRENMKKRIPL